MGALFLDVDPDPSVGAAVVLANDDFLAYVDQTAGEVTGVRRPQRRIRKSLPSPVRRDEVFEHRQALAEVRSDRTRDDLPTRVGHEPSHTRDLADLLDVPTSS